MSLLELLITISITCSITIYGLPRLGSLPSKFAAAMYLQYLQHGLFYARSRAIVTRGKVKVCPSIDGYSCAKSWRGGLLMVDSLGEIYFFETQIGVPLMAVLHQSGIQNNYLEIQANGMTYNNGHFTISYKFLGEITQYKLYFNKGLRVYMRESWFR